MEVSSCIICNDWRSRYRSVIRPGTIRIELEAAEIEEEIAICRIGKLEFTAQHLLELGSHCRLTNLRIISL